jgi:trimethylamine--corrinoid protein Co-methyltransferase
MAEMTFKPEGSAAEIGFEALADVQPGGHFFATQHTMDRYQSAFYAPLVADLQNFGAWEEAGAQTSAMRATAIWQRILAEFTPPETGRDVAERLAGYVAEKTAAGGAAPLD